MVHFGTYPAHKNWMGQVPSAIPCHSDIIVDLQTPAANKMRNKVAVRVKYTVATAGNKV